MVWERRYLDKGSSRSLRHLTSRHKPEVPSDIFRKPVREEDILWDKESSRKAGEEVEVEAEDRV